MVLLTRNKFQELYIIRVHRHNLCTLNRIGSSGLGVRIILKVSPDNLVIK